MNNEAPVKTKKSTDLPPVKQMNIFQKLCEARRRLSNMEIKKTGKNQNMRENYMQLEDFLPQLNRINADLGLLPVISFYRDRNIAEMVIYDADSDPNGEAPTLTFTSPLGTCNLPKVQETQNEGAVQTYVRRYLYMTAYEISETDALDSEVARRKETLRSVLKNDYGCDLNAIARFYHVQDESELTDEMLLSALGMKSKANNRKSKTTVPDAANVLAGALKEENNDMADNQDNQDSPQDEVVF